MKMEVVDDGKLKDFEGVWGDLLVWVEGFFSSDC